MSQPKKRGVKTGNKNALDHGYYSLGIPPDIEWQLLDQNTDSLDGEINSIRLLMSRLAVAQRQPDPDLKDPDVPYKMLLLAAHRLDIVRALHAKFQDPLSAIARDSRDLNSHFEQTSYLYTIQNLEKAASLMLGEKYVPMAEYLPPQLLKKYDYILTRQRLHNKDDLEDNDLEDNQEQPDEI